MSEYYDHEETRPPEMRETALFHGFAAALCEIAAKSESWAARLAAVDTDRIASRADLAAIPVLRKPELMAKQQELPPFGGFVTGSPGQYARVFTSPGPVWEPQGPGADPWRGARALFAAGFRKGDVVHNALSYHLTPGGFLLDEAARALGCAVFPAGIGNTEAQVEAIAMLRPNGFTGTPDYLKVLLDHAEKSGKDASSIRKALVSGGALFPSLRAEYAARGVAVYQCYATADLGVVAYETPALEGLVVNEGIILEIVRPGSDDPVPDGEVGEIVVTSLNPVYPLIRFGTGDLSAVMEGASPCGRTNMRIRGWMGRADQRTKVKGMFVDPKQVDAVVKRFPAVTRARLEIGRAGEQDTMTLKVEVRDPGERLCEEIAAALREVTRLSGRVETAAPGSLPNDGRIIADERTYD